MKKIMRPVLAAIMLIFFAASVFLFLTASNRIENQVIEISFLPFDTDESFPEEIQNIISSSCINCHASGGKALAMAKLNFSEWDQYDREKQMKKAAKMCELLTEGKMPPKSYIKNHPEVVLTKEQIEIVCKWAESIQQENQ